MLILRPEETMSAVRCKEYTYFKRITLQSLRTHPLNLRIPRLRLLRHLQFSLVSPSAFVNMPHVRLSLLPE